MNSLTKYYFQTFHVPVMSQRYLTSAPFLGFHVSIPLFKLKSDHHLLFRCVLNRKYFILAHLTLYFLNFKGQVTIKNLEVSLLLLPLLSGNCSFLFFFYFFSVPSAIKAQKFHEESQAYKCTVCAIDSTIVICPEKELPIAVFLQALPCLFSSARN